MIESDKIKSLKELALNITEGEYRALPSISQSALAQYTNRGPRAIKDMLEGKRFEASFLDKGSLLDTLIFFGEEGVNKRFAFISDEDYPPQSIKLIIENIFNTVGPLVSGFEKVPDTVILDAARMAEFQQRWKEETVIKHIRERGTGYFDFLRANLGKTILTKADYQNSIQALRAIRESPYTSYLFKDHPVTEVLTQIKFEINGLKMMADWIVVNHADKTVRIIDLKSTGKSKDEFEKSFIQFGYYLQATMYTQILKDVISKDEYFKDFKVLPFQFLVINVEELIPQLYEFPYSDNDNDFVTYSRRKVKGYKTLIREYRWFLEHKKFDYSYEAYHNNGVVLLKDLRP